ncbi:MAG: cupin domain-containing protein [Chloroflexi bacterium]|nr:cupin domain-containing protein [Chloroflexota bacterium]MCC6891691.1 cupin domain-containing protein [Anaerolineae bacterium]
MAQIDHNNWMEQPRLLNERCRGLPLIWTPDVKWFNNDWLGPTPHVHDDATEIGFMAQGSLEIQIGGSKRIYKKGDFVIMPPNKYHNYWFAGDETACFFVVVGPNHKHNRLRHKDFTPDNYEGDAPHANIYETDQLPSNEHFKAERIVLQPGESTSEQKLTVQDRVFYIVSGAAQVRSNKLSGELVANEYIHIPATTPHQISNTGSEPVMILSLIVTDPFSARAVLEHTE